MDGTSFAAGKSVRIDATVWAWTTPSADRLDLYSTANAASPSWTLVATLTPAAAGAQTLSANYTLPAGATQAVRARFRYQGAVSSCATGGYIDHDDLVFAVTPPPPATTVFEDTFETDLGWTRNAERHRHGDARSLGARRSGGHHLQRRQAARHHGERRATTW